MKQLGLGVEGRDSKSGLEINKYKNQCECVNKV